VLKLAPTLNQNDDRHTQVMDVGSASDVIDSGRLVAVQRDGGPFSPSAVGRYAALRIPLALLSVVRKKAVWG
jgi:hypothetical protein